MYTTGQPVTAQGAEKYFEEDFAEAEKAAISASTSQQKNVEGDGEDEKNGHLQTNNHDQSIERSGNSSVNLSDELPDAAAKQREVFPSSILQQQIPQWHGKLANRFGLSGAVDQHKFAALCRGLHPLTGEQLIRRVKPRLLPDKPKKFERASQIALSGEEILSGQKEKKQQRSKAHRAGLDQSISAPKSVSLVAEYDERIVWAHWRSAVKTIEAIEKFVRAKLGGSKLSALSGQALYTSFLHRTARPDHESGFAAPDLHTHFFQFNLVLAPDGKLRALETREIYRCQKFATAVYRAELLKEMRKLGYEMRIDEKTGAPEIVGISRAYIEAGSPRQAEIRETAARLGIKSTKIVASRYRRGKDFDADEMRERWRKMDERFDNQAAKAASAARAKARQLSSESERQIKSQTTGKTREFETKEIKSVRDSASDFHRQVAFDAERANVSRAAMDAAIALAREKKPSKVTGRRWATRQSLLTDALVSSQLEMTIDEAAAELKKRESNGELEEFDLDRSKAGSKKQSEIAIDDSQLIRIENQIREINKTVEIEESDEPNRKESGFFQTGTGTGELRAGEITGSGIATGGDDISGDERGIAADHRIIGSDSNIKRTTEFGKHIPAAGNSGAEPNAARSLLELGDDDEGGIVTEQPVAAVDGIGDPRSGDDGEDPATFRPARGNTRSVRETANLRELGGDFSSPVNSSESGTRSHRFIVRTNDEQQDEFINDESAVFQSNSANDADQNDGLTGGNAANWRQHRANRGKYQSRGSANAANGNIHGSNIDSATGTISEETGGDYRPSADSGKNSSEALFTAEAVGTGGGESGDSGTKFSISSAIATGTGISGGSDATGTGMGSGGAAEKAAGRREGTGGSEAQIQREEYEGISDVGEKSSREVGELPLSERNEESLSTDAENGNQAIYGDSAAGEDFGTELPEGSLGFGNSDQGTKTTTGGSDLGGQIFGAFQAADDRRGILNGVDDWLDNDDDYGGGLASTRLAIGDSDLFADHCYFDNIPADGRSILGDAQISTEILREKISTIQKPALLGDILLTDDSSRLDVLADLARRSETFDDSGDSWMGGNLGSPELASPIQVRIEPVKPLSMISDDESREIRRRVSFARDEAERTSMRETDKSDDAERRRQNENTQDEQKETERSEGIGEMEI